MNFSISCSFLESTVTSSMSSNYSIVRLILSIIPYFLIHIPPSQVTQKARSWSITIVNTPGSKIVSTNGGTSQLDRQLTTIQMLLVHQSQFRFQHVYLNSEQKTSFHLISPHLRLLPRTPKRVVSVFIPPITAYVSASKATTARAVYEWLLVNQASLHPPTLNLAARE
jgi:hypothetical protein